MLNDLMTALQNARQQMPDRFAEVLGMAPEQPAQGYVPGTVGAAARDPQQVKSGLDALGNALYQIAKSMFGVTAYEDLTKAWQQGNPEKMVMPAIDLATMGPSGGLDDLLKGIGPALGMLVGSKAKGFEGLAGKFSSLYDKKQRAAISDFGSTFKSPKAYEGSHKLEKVLDHPALYKHVPDLKNVDVTFDRNFSSGIAGMVGSDRIVINPDKLAEAADRANIPVTQAYRLALLHESQHFIQNTMGLASGSQGKFVTPKEAEALYRSMPGLPGHNYEISSEFEKDLNKALKAEGYVKPPTEKQHAKSLGYEGLSTIPAKKRAEVYRQYIESIEEQSNLYNRVRDKVETNYYNRSAGEIEANATTKNADIPQDQMAHHNPYAKSKVGPKDAIVKFTPNDWANLRGH